MGRNIRLTLFLTASFFTIFTESWASQGSSSSTPSISQAASSHSASQADAPIHVEAQPRNAGAEITSIRDALVSRISGTYGDLAKDTIKKLDNKEFPGPKVDLSQARAAVIYYNEHLTKIMHAKQQELMKLMHAKEIEHVRAGGVNTEAVKRVAAELISGVSSFGDLLFLFPFMIGIAENEPLIEEGLKKTREAIENVERQKKEYEDDKSILSLEKYLRMPTFNVAAEKTSNVEELKKAVGVAFKDFMDFRTHVTKDTNPSKEVKPIYNDFLSDNEIKSKGRPYTFFGKMLGELNGILMSPSVDVVKLDQFVTQKADDISEAFKCIMLIDASPSEKTALQTKALTNLKGFDGLKVSLKQLSSQLNKLEKMGQYGSNLKNFKERAGNVILQALSSKNPQMIFQQLTKDQDYFVVSDKEITFDTDEMKIFETAVDQKDKTLSTPWFRKIFESRKALYSAVVNLRLAAPGKGANDPQPSWYSNKEKLKTLLQENVIAIIDSEIRKSSDTMGEDALKNLIWNNVSNNFVTDFKVKIDRLVDEKLAQHRKKENKNPLLDMMRKLYDAQCAHANFVQKMHDLKKLIGNRLDKIKPEDGPVEFRAVNLREMCNDFTQPHASYYNLESDKRADYYALALGALASNKAWEKLGFAKGVEQTLVDALRQTREAYLVARDIIRLLTLNDGDTLWAGFNMDATPLTPFAPKGGVGGNVGTSSSSSSSSGGPKIVPGGLVSPVEWDNKLQKLLPDAYPHKVEKDAYFPAVKDAFLQEIIDDWKKFDYVPNIDKYLEGARVKYNALPDVKEIKTLAEFKEHLKTLK